MRADFNYGALLIAAFSVGLIIAATNAALAIIAVPIFTVLGVRHSQKPFRRARNLVKKFKEI